jgi:hypothetical protein
LLFGAGARVVRKSSSVSAPQKVFVTLEDAGHNALVYSAGAFLEALNANALPLARAAASGR